MNCTFLIKIQEPQYILKKEVNRINFHLNHRNFVYFSAILFFFLSSMCVCIYSECFFVDSEHRQFSHVWHSANTIFFLCPHYNFGPHTAGNRFYLEPKKNNLLLFGLFFFVKSSDLSTLVKQKKEIPIWKVCDYQHFRLTN